MENLDLISEKLTSKDVAEMIQDKEGILANHLEQAEVLRQGKQSTAAEYEAARSKGDQLAMLKCRKKLTEIDEELKVTEDVIAFERQDLEKMKIRFSVLELQEEIRPAYNKRKAEYQSLVDKVQSLQSRALSIVEEFHTAAEKLLNMPLPTELLLSSAARLPKGKGISLQNIMDGTLGPTCETEAEETAANLEVIRAELDSLLKFESPSIGKVPDLVKTVDALRERHYFTASLWSRRLRMDLSPTSGKISDGRGMISSVAKKVDAPDPETEHDAKSGFFQTNPAPGNDDPWAWAK